MACFSPDCVSYSGMARATATCHPVAVVNHGGSSPAIGQHSIKQSRVSMTCVHDFMNTSLALLDDLLRWMTFPICEKYHPYNPFTQ